MRLSRRDARLLIGAIYRADDWTAESIMSLKGCTAPADRREARRERTTRIRYAKLRERLERFSAGGDRDDEQ